MGVFGWLIGRRRHKATETAIERVGTAGASGNPDTVARVSPLPPRQRQALPASDRLELLGGDPLHLRPVGGFAVPRIAGEHAVGVEPVQVPLVPIVAQISLPCPSLHPDDRFRYHSGTELVPYSE